MKQTIEFGVCGPGRHEISNASGKEIDLFVFPAVVENPLDYTGNMKTAMDFLKNNTAQPHHPEALAWTIYVTGLTPCLTAILLALKNLVPHSTIILMHFNRDTGGYEPQRWQN